MQTSDSFDSALALHREQKLDDAEAMYGRILAQTPDHPDALHFLGVLRHQRGDLEGASALMQRSVALKPEIAGWHSNLGNVLRTLKRDEEASEAYARSLALNAEDPRTHNNLASLHRKQGRYGEAEEGFRRALTLEPRYLEAWNNLGNLYRVCGFTEAALRAYSEAIVLMTFTRGTRDLQARALRFLGREAEALECYRAWLTEEPNNPIPRHQLAGFTGEGVPDRANDTYIEEVFEHFAESFDENLAALEYRAPEYVAAFVNQTCPPPDRSLEILDAGCGTGLCGPYLRPYARRLVGVDLSAAMLAKAEKRALYDSLEKAELTAYVQQQSGAFDLVVSADTFCYFGKLDALISGAYGSLREGGWLVFTVEVMAADAATSDAGTPGYHLSPHGRYSHRRDYVEHVMVEAGFGEIAIAPVTLRMEMMKPVAGYVIAGKRG